MPDTTKLAGHRIVVGVDGSDHSKQALRWAAFLAASLNADLVAVTAWQYPVNFGWAMLPAQWNPADDNEKMLTAIVDEIFGAHRPANIHLIVREGYAASALIDECDETSILVVGSRGHGGFAGLLLGSVSANVAEHAHCPVFVIHGDQPIPAVAVTHS